MVTRRTGQGCECAASGHDDIDLQRDRREIATGYGGTLVVKR